MEGVTANDVTGALAMAAGVVLVGLAAWIPFRHRGQGATTPARRWAIRVAMVPAAVLAVYFVFGPVGMGMVDIHSLHRPIGEPPSADYRPCASPRPTASAWRAGTGADIAIDIASRREDVKAVVADGAAAIGYRDIEGYTDDTLTRAPMWVLFKSLEVIQGRSGPKESLADQIARSKAPHLIVSAGKAEKEWGELYDKAGGARSELWHLPNAAHTAALRQYPAAYEQRVVSFLDANLRAR